MGRAVVGVWLLLATLGACGRIGFDPEGTSAGTGDGTAPTANIAFVTSTEHVPGSFTGLADADAICRKRAQEAGFTGTFVAWLSTTTVAARDRLGSARGWVRPDGLPVVDRVADLVARHMIQPLRIDERGIDVGADDSVVVATGTYIDGAANSNCTDFTNPGGTVRVGLPFETGGSWTARTTAPCSMPARLYCFQIDLSIPLTIAPATGPRAFISTTLFDPRSGLAMADAACTTDATAANLGGGPFRALVAAPGGAASRFPSTGLPWVRMDGVPIADSIAALMSANTRAPLNVDANGNYSSTLAFTGFHHATDVEDQTKDCNGWSNAGGGAMAGTGESSATGLRIYEDTEVACIGITAPVYCLE